MIYDKPLSKCKCGRKPKHIQNGSYGKYICEECGLSTFFCQNGCELESWNAMIEHLDKLKVKI